MPHMNLGAKKALPGCRGAFGMRSVSPQALYIIQMDSVRLTKEGYALHKTYLTLLDRVSLTLAPHKISPALSRNRITRVRDYSAKPCLSQTTRLLRIRTC